MVFPLFEAGYLRVTQPFAANYVFSEENEFARLACIRRAANVRPEPGSNSLIDVCSFH